MKKHWHMANLAPCPICRSTHQRLTASIEGLWVVVCEDCGTTGPSCYYKGEAMECWESLSLPVAHAALAFGEEAGC